MTQDMEAAQYHLSRGARKNRTWKTSFALRVGLLVASHCLLASQNTTTGVHSEYLFGGSFFVVITMAPRLALNTNDTVTVTIHAWF